MTLLCVMLMSSALVSLVQSFPSTMNEKEREFISKLLLKENADPKSKQAQQLQAMLADHKESPIEFVYKSHTGNSNSETGTDREKYTINVISDEKENNKNNGMKQQKNSSQSFKIENVKKNEFHRSNITATTKRGHNLLAEAYIQQNQWSLTPEEVSPITGGIPKLFYEILYPISAFPEIHKESRQNEATDAKKITSVQSPLLTDNINRAPQNAGPILYPQSTYIREFDLPFY